MKKWEDENAGTFLVLRRKTGFHTEQVIYPVNAGKVTVTLPPASGIVLQHKDPVQEKRSKAKTEQKNFLHFM